MKKWFFPIILPAMVFVASADEAGNVINDIVRQGLGAKEKIQTSFTQGIDKQYQDRVAIDMILNHEFVKTVEYIRQVTAFPDIADQSKKFELPNLQAALIIYTKAQNKPLPEDLMKINKDIVLSLNQMIAIESERSTRKAHNPYAESDMSKNAEEEKQLTALKSTYYTLEKSAASIKLDKYGVDVQNYNKQIVPMISRMINEVKNRFQPQGQVAALNKVFDQLQR